MESTKPKELLMKQAINPTRGATQHILERLSTIPLADSASPSSSAQEVFPIASAASVFTNTAISPQAFDTFHPFTRLPIELRLAIWKLTLEPRTLSVIKRQEEFYIENSKPGLPFPATFYANREARETVKNLYELVATTEDRQMYVNWQLDIFKSYATSRSWAPSEAIAARNVYSLVSYAPQEIRDKIRNLIVKGDFNILFARRIHKLRGLKTLALDLMLKDSTDGFSEDQSAGLEALVIRVIRCASYDDKQARSADMPMVTFLKSESERFG